MACLPWEQQRNQRESQKLAKLRSRICRNNKLDRRSAKLKRRIPGPMSGRPKREVTGSLIDVGERTRSGGDVIRSPEDFLT